jgi:hypothetical protein
MGDDKKPSISNEPTPKPANVVPAFPLNHKSDPRPGETRIEKPLNRE